MASHDNLSASFRTSLPAILLLTSMFFFNFGSRLMPGPALPAIENDLGLNHAWAGMLLLGLGLGGCLSQLVVGVLVAFWDYKKVILASTFGVTLTMALAGFSQGFWSLGLALLGLGLFGGLYASAGISLIIQVTPQPHWGKAMGIHEVAPNLGLMITPLLMAWCLSNASWRAAFLLSAGANLVIGAVFIIWGRGTGVHDQLPSFSTLRSIVTKASFWIITTLLIMGVGTEIGVYSVLTLFLCSERGYDPVAANQILGLSRLVGLPMVLASGWICDRLGLKRALFTVMAGAGLVILVLGLAPASLTPILVVAQAAFSACIFPPILAAASALSDPANRVWTLGISLGLTYILASGGIPAAVALAGQYGHFGLGISGIGVLVLLATLLIPLLDLD